MAFIEIPAGDMDRLRSLQISYKREIGEELPSEEDFYIEPECRHRGIARKLLEFSATQSGVGSLTVGCADCDVEMYRALGFSLKLGNMLAYGE